jgi:ABC-2 type transport system ATP-binding protein
MIIKTKNLCKSFGDKEILKQINMEVPKGCIYALLGPNGAGKTTTIRILTGLLKPLSGEVSVQGIDVVKHPEDIRAEIGVLSQESCGYKDFNTTDNILLFTSMVGIDEETARAKMFELLDKLDMLDKLDLKFGKLSGGEKRVINLVRTIISSRELIILDEPTTGLDIARAKKVRDLINDLVQNEGRTVVMSSHITTDLEALATHAGILRDGVLIFQGTKDQVIKKYNPSGDFEEAIINAFENGSIIPQVSKTITDDATKEAVT